MSDECPVCLDPDKTGDVLIKCVASESKHVSFCTDCGIDLLKCPVCRANISSPGTLRDNVAPEISEISDFRVAQSTLGTDLIPHTQTAPRLDAGQLNIYTNPYVNPQYIRVRSPPNYRYIGFADGAGIPPFVGRIEPLPAHPTIPQPTSRSEISQRLHDRISQLRQSRRSRR